MFTVQELVEMPYVSLNKSLHDLMNKMFKDQISFLRKLVKTKSANPYTPEYNNTEDPIEREVADLILEKANEYGLSYKEVGRTKERANIVIEVGEKDGEHSLILNTHMDTIVPPKSYSFDPYSGAIKDGRVYGVGAADAKGCIASFFYVGVLLELLNIQLGGKVVLEFVVDEEPGAISEIGTKYLLQKGIVGDAAIIGEPGCKIINVGHRGGYRFKLITYGEAIHTGSLMWERRKRGRNAIIDMIKIINELSDLENVLNSVNRNAAKNYLFKDRKIVVTFPAIIRGGENVNVVPSICEAYDDIRLVPGITKDDIKRAIEKIERLNVNYELKDLVFVPAVYIPPQEPIVKILKKNIIKVMGYIPRIGIAGPWNDGWIFINKGIPTICGFGPIGGGVHGKDEWVDVVSVKNVTLTLVGTVLDFLGFS